MSAMAFAFVATPLHRRAADGTAKLVAFAAVAFLLAGATLYFAIGRPDAAIVGTTPTNDSKSLGAAPSDTKVASVNQLLSGLEDRLREDPDDGKGWLLLAKSYDHLGRTSDSAAAYARAKELGIEDAELAARTGKGSRAIRYPLDPNEVEDVNALVN